MQFGVLGPLTVSHEGVDLTPSAPKQRQMIALLLLTHGHTVSIDQFVTELWDDNPTPTANASVYTYIMQLRRVICDDGGTGRPPRAAEHRLVTLDHAYRLNVLSGEFDLDTFNSRARAGRAKLMRGENEAAAALFRDALSLWNRGPVLPDVVTGPLLFPTTRDLESSRLDVLGQRIRTEMRLGLHHELVSELSALHCQHPTNEVFTVQLMLALHRSGRRADALDVFRHYRTTLSKELGLGPSVRLHKLCTDILRGHPRLELPSNAPTSSLSLDLAADLAS
ncbi:hypothetical protein ALI144C_36655 [Actinosynnema sp. ALI-1.44]|uniref:AfsR/SARP family transcriptional regulator n=1 Tax=Actinosynnema sp. ALI-1.44 TaxID=1933779 RepID=UPI00097C1568|nr:AfsR/SARP family transcriptional regulator [Actinosynnema sp. ALI-1.44]ONI76207.1 hypothetical protein ALI144C_36655 [Actinosynnema sp. ALI-1.44]